MYRIVIADDEPLIIRGLKKMMKWGAMDTEVVGQAEDGDQLLPLLTGYSGTRYYYIGYQYAGKNRARCFKRNK